jgi:Tol biopolymer transport system component
MRLPIKSPAALWRPASRKPAGPVLRLLSKSAAAVQTALLFGCASPEAESGTSAQPNLGSHIESLGAFDSRCQVDSVAHVETIDGCRVALAICNAPNNFKLHVIIDGKIVPGFDDVAARSVIFSPDGEHVAFVANRDGKKLCWEDGKVGPEFDRIGLLGTDFGDALAFSPDGRHLGYEAEKGNKAVVVVDDVTSPEYDGVGELGPQLPRAKVVNGVPTRMLDRSVATTCPGFTQDSRHFIYSVYRVQPNHQRTTRVVMDGRPLGLESSNISGPYMSPDRQHMAIWTVTGKLAQLYYDGVPEPPFEGGGAIVFSNDSKHHGYIAGGSGKNKPFTVVIDGKPGPSYYFINNLSFSPGGGHSVYYADSWNPDQPSFPHQAHVILDGAEFAPEGYAFAQVYFSGDGQHIAYSTAKDGARRIVVDGVIGPPLPVLNNVFLSNNGAHVACIAVSGQRQQVLLDYLPGPFFDSVDDYSVRFNPDGSRLAYVGKTGRQSAVVADGRVGPEFDSIAQRFPVFSPDGRHLVYVGRKGATFQVVADGVPGPELQEIDEDSVVYSPDSRTLIYVGTRGDKMKVFVNGAPGPGFDDVRRDAPFISPNGKHVAYVARTGLPVGQDGFDRNPGREWVVTDGRRGPKFDEIALGAPMFSSDGERVAYVGAMRETAIRRATQRLVVDGAPGPEFASIVAGPVECRDGRLEYLAIQGYDADTRLVRVTVPGFGPTKP